MSSSAASGIKLSLSYLSALDVGKRSRGAAIGLLFYDFLITLDQEVDLVWTKRKRHPAFYLYIINSWLAFAYYVFDTIPLTPSGVVASKPTVYYDCAVPELPLIYGFPKRCIIYLMCDAMVTLIATVLVQVFLQLRIYALYERSRKILTALLILSAAEISAMAVLVGYTMSQLQRLPLVSTPTGCAYEGFLSVFALFWIPGLVVEPILFALVAYRAWGSTRIPIIQRVARGSLIYFIVIFAQLLINTVIWARYPEYINIFNPWSAALPSLLGSRLFLGTRSLVLKQGGPSYINETYYAADEDQELTMVFASAPG